MKLRRKSGSRLLPEILLTSGEQRALRSGPRPPFLVTPHWVSLLDGTSDDPLRLQAVPGEQEKTARSSELADPLGEELYSPLARLIHRYADRALVVMTGRCALYCRHCFRRRLTGGDFGEISSEQVRAIARWTAANPAVHELLLSGGDPLTMNERVLLRHIDTFREARPDIVLRLATRIPVVDPGRITSSLARGLGRRKPVWIVVQTNHPREISPEFLRAAERLQKQGLPVVNQAVLLKGVNDKVETLARLSRELVRAGIKPYYLFQGDLAEGTGHFRLPLDEARGLVEELRKQVSGLAMPNFAVDLPGGHGKVPLGFDYVGGKSSEGWKLTTPDGRSGFYPDPDDGENT